MSRMSWCAGLVVVGLLATNGFARADVKLPKVLASNMVLQQKQAIPIWGTADAGEEVTVSIGGNKATAKAGADGKWSVKLKELTAGGGPVEVVVKGKNEVKLTNVLIGEVWVASGQSNMEWSVAASLNPKEEIEAAKYPNIRLFHVKKTPAVTPQEVVLDRDWSECSPETIANFSAVAYFFGRHLHKELNVPIGLINTSWGGTAIEPWTPIAGFESVESLKPIADQVKAL